MRRALASLLVVLAFPATAGAVVGGRAATEAYPWMVSIQTGGGQYCGGTLVRPDWVLTAAHCTDGMKPSDFTAVIGRHKLSSSDGEEHAVDGIVQNPAYADDANGGHDVSLLHLAQPSAAQPIRLVGTNENALWAGGKDARIVGWGSSVFLVGPASDDLMEVDTHMVSDADCDTSYNGLSPYVFDPQTMVCAGEPTGLKDSCQGDSGGPLLVKDAAGQWVQVGDTSFGLGCGFPIYYGVYGRLGAPVMHDWIQAQLPPAGTTTASPAPAPAVQGEPGTPAPAPSGSQPASQAPAPAPAPSLRWSGPLRTVRRHGSRSLLKLQLRSTGRVSDVRAVLRAGGKVLARGRTSRVDGKAALLLPVRGRVRARSLRIALVGVDASGRTVKRSGAVRLAR